MTDQRAKGNRNLTIMTWMGLAFQLAGLILMVADISTSNPSAIRGGLLLVFGMALSGWAGNLQQITDLKYRVSELEVTAAADSRVI
jgi:hypothetical protein